ncbi:MAG: hypothetical protein V4605_08910 [Pseudomonadota bacterium]
MLLKYVFNSDEVAVLDKARAVFNRFTGQNFNIQQYIDYSIQQAIAFEVNTAKELSGVMEAYPLIDFRLKSDAQYAH